jgi:hypothetical protein
MDDDKVRELLGRYRPAGPPAELRERALTITAKPLRTWPWAAAAAVLLTTALGLHAATNRALSRVAEPAAPPSVDALADALGADEDAQRAARLIVMERLLRNVPGQRGVNNELEELINGSR